MDVTVTPRSITALTQVNTPTPTLPRTERKFDVVVIFYRKTKTKTTIQSQNIRQSLSGFLMFIAMFIYFLFLLLVVIDTDNQFSATLLFEVASHLFRFLE